MKILMTSETFLPAIGGAEIHIQNLLEQIKKAGHEVTLFTNQPGEVEEAVVRVPWLKSNVVTIFLTIWKMSKGCDIIHAHYSYRLAFFVGIIGLIRRIPVVVTLHGLGTLDPAQASFFTRIKDSFYRYTSLLLATKIISTSEDLAIVAYRYVSQSKVSIIMNGYDDTLFQKRLSKINLNDSKKKCIVTVRRLVPKNGIHYLIEAMPFILEKNKNIQYIIIGDGPMYTQIKNRIKELDIEENVSMLGRLENTEISEYLEHADVVVFPSTAESSSIACAEAMGMSKMIVASKVGGLIELLGRKNERGLLVTLVPWEGSNYDAPMTLPIEKYQLLATTILSALEDTQVNNQRKDNAYQYAKTELSWEAIFKKTISVYSSI